MMIAVGEASGDLGGALDNVANYYNEEIPRRVKKIFSVMEPLVMLFLILVVGFTALSIIMPIVEMYGGIK
jgi:type II secretory pathway component PulF